MSADLSNRPDAETVRCGRCFGVWHLVDTARCPWCEKREDG